MSGDNQRQVLIDARKSGEEFRSSDPCCPPPSPAPRITPTFLTTLLAALRLARSCGSGSTPASQSSVTTT